MARLHILGASGSGTTALGAALADRLGCAHVDADSLFWLPTDPPFTTKRPKGERQAMLLRLLPVAGQWVFSGSAPEWAKPVEPFYDLVVFLRLDPAVRMKRLRRREAARYGKRIETGGDMAAASSEFLKWAEAYDTAGPEQRSLVGHEAWLATLQAPVLRLDSATPLADLIFAVLSRLADRQ
jgi:adenylate kinase family enzyme